MMTANSIPSVNARAAKIFLEQRARYEANQASYGLPAVSIHQTLAAQGPRIRTIRQVNGMLPNVPYKDLTDEDLIETFETLAAPPQVRDAATIRAQLCPLVLSLPQGTRAAITGFITGCREVYDQNQIDPEDHEASGLYRDGNAQYDAFKSLVPLQVKRLSA